jgi:hypothetical protein
MLTNQELQDMEARANAATEGPWCYESCGEKGDGANVIGVAFGPDDDDCKTPLTGELFDSDDEGELIDYYRDVEVTVCEHRNPNCNADAAFITAARTDLPRVIAELREARAVIESIANSIGDTCAIAAIVNNYINNQIVNEYLKREGKG